MVEAYKTIVAEATAEVKEKGSKFLAYAYPVINEEQVREKLNMLKKKYHDARHHCYAFILNPEGNQYRAADDGEPSHSAGDPILGQIRSFELTNTLVVVVRYFGGTKLGIGGLIHAYKTAASEALSNAKMVVEKVRVPFSISYNYNVTSEVMRFADELDIIIKKQVFKERCFLEGEIIISQQEQLKDKVRLLQDLKNDLQLTL